MVSKLMFEFGSIPCFNCDWVQSKTFLVLSGTRVKFSSCMIFYSFIIFIGDKYRVILVKNFLSHIFKAYLWQFLEKTTTIIIKRLLISTHIQNIIVAS